VSNVSCAVVHMAIPAAGHTPHKQILRYSDDTASKIKIVVWGNDCSFPSITRGKN
jgi:hypothetical protein